MQEVAEEFGSYVSHSNVPVEKPHLDVGADEAGAVEAVAVDQPPPQRERLRPVGVQHLQKQDGWEGV